jgi:beta-glucanase (GH16 family)
MNVSQSKSRPRLAACALAGSLCVAGVITLGATSGGAADKVLRATGSTCSGTAPPVASPSWQWSCTFDDEFNGTALDPTKWQPMLTSTSSYHTGPSGSYVCYMNDPRTISESGGTLNLSVINSGRSFQCNEIMHSFWTKYVGGMATSNGLFSQQYGYFQARVLLPAQATRGVQETLWLYPLNQTLYGAWPDSGEIDFGEFYSRFPNLDVPVIHYHGSTRDPNATSNNCAIAGQTTAGQWHTYALKWTPTTLTTYYDGMTCFTDTYAPYATYPDTPPKPFTQPFFLNLTQALGVGTANGFQAWTTSLPVTTKVDWVRVWQY